MDLSTTYLGLKLPHPFMPGASPLVDDVNMVKRLEDAGAAAIVMHSLFEEQIARERYGRVLHLRKRGVSSAQALRYLPSPERFALGPEEYLAQIVRIKETVHIPVIASLNGTTPGGWLNYASLIERAGADALELNISALTIDPEESAQAVEDRTIEMLLAVKRTIGIPVAVKLSPFHTSLAHFARRLDEAHADGLVLFNRFYEPNIDPGTHKPDTRTYLSTPHELPLRLQWLAILSGRVRPSLAVTGGVHEALDAVKAVMAGAHAVQVVSALLLKGPEHLRRLRAETEAWMQRHGHESLEMICGSTSLAECPDPGLYERTGDILRRQQHSGS